MKYVLLLVLLVVFAPSSPSQTVEPNPVVGDVCEVYKNPEKYVGKEMELTVNFVQELNMPGLISGTGCESDVIAVSIIAAMKKQDRDDIDRKLQHNNVQYLGRTVTIVMRGQLSKNKYLGHSAIGGLLQDYTMYINKVVRVLKVSPPVN
jgi:hypothetical protein